MQAADKKRVMKMWMKGLSWSHVYSPIGSLLDTNKEKFGLLTGGKGLSIWEQFVCVCLLAVLLDLKCD